jgi:membrane protein implicated in regulation of membrane protease activity
VTTSKRLPVLFLMAALGVLAVVGVVLGDLLGWPAAAAYSLVVLALLVLGVRRFRPRPAPRDHSGCACCSGEPFRGVEIVP